MLKAAEDEWVRMKAEGPIGEREQQQRQTRVGRVNYSVVEACKSVWQSEGTKHKSKGEQAAAMAAMITAVKNACPDALDRDATLDYIQQTISSW